MALTLAEKCALVACFGDVSQEARDRLLAFATISPRSGVLIGSSFIGSFDQGRVVVRLRPSLLDN